ncbi:MAG: hypothetical protein PF637_05070 [Spirochaetes bacterium]|nr:hypothetical protein [Spirochaetota bacterium]
MSDIVGHSVQISRLVALSASSRLPQTFLFAGPSGIGKRKVADYFAQLLICKKGESKPCGVCSPCHSFLSGSFQDFISLQPDENGKIAVGSDEEEGTVRWFTHRLTEKAISDRYIAIIDGVDRISESGQNILLKTVEEPGEGVIVILIASSKTKVLSTVLSRSLCLDFYPLQYEQIVQILNISPEHHSLEDLALIASGGSVSITQELLNNDILASVLTIAHAIKETLISGRNFSEDLSKYEKLVSNFSLYDILINLYHYNMRLVISEELQYNRFLEKLYIDDYDLLHKLLKRLIIVKNEQRFNTNSKYALKAALYELVESLGI